MIKRLYGAHGSRGAAREGVLTCKCRLAYRFGVGEADLLFKALANPGRRKLLDRLHAHDGQTLSELSGTWT